MVLFNLLAPAGWRIGLLRIQDVALGCAVSLVIGILIWPHGAAAVVGDDLADAFRRGGAYLTQAVDWALGLRPDEPAPARPPALEPVHLADPAPAVAPASESSPGAMVAEEDVAMAESLVAADTVAVADAVREIRPQFLWVHEHLRHLSARVHAISGPATRLAELRRQPWWR